MGEMPKENINDEVTDGWRFEVSWKRDETDTGGTSGHVQVASVNAHSPFCFPEDEDGKAEHFDGWRVFLDEEGIDRAISALTKAKRQAFPADHDAEVLLYEAWGLIANAGWDAHRAQVDLEKSPGWHEAAIRWRDRYHAHLSAWRAGQKPDITVNMTPSSAETEEVVSRVLKRIARTSRRH